jgi:MFS family permease
MATPAWISIEPSSYDEQKHPEYGRGSESKLLAGIVGHTISCLGILVLPRKMNGRLGIISIANGAGRFLWAWLSDAIGRKSVFLMMFLVQCVAFFFLAHVRSFGMLATLAFIVLLCYGGGFGTMPAFAADFFGSREVGSIYGLMLTAWGFGALFGPTIIAHVREASGHYSGAMQIMSVVMLASAALPMLLRPPKIDAEDPRPLSAQSA